MNMSKLLLAIAALFIGFSAMGQDVVYVDASVFPVYGKISGETNERYERLPAEGMIGDDGEATVDSRHYTDLGNTRYVEHIMPVIRKALR